METALLITIAAVVGGGILGACVRAWSILARLYSLENQVAIVERTLTSYVKREAALARPIRRGEKDILDEIQAGQPPKQVSAGEPWFARFVHKDLKKA